MRILLRIILIIAMLCTTVAAIIFGWWRFGNWEARTVRDLQFIYTTIERHHPGPVDPLNPGFLVTMDDALDRAMDLAEGAQSSAHHHKALKTFTDSFQDGHLSVFFFDRALGYLTKKQDSVTPSSGRVEMTLEDGAAWVSIPSFNESFSAIAVLTAEIEDRATELRDAELIVLDLRGNSGGDSSFGTRIAIALWSEEVYFDWVPVSATGIEWRASASNAKHVQGIAAKNKRKGRTSSAESWQKIAEAIDTAAIAGEDYYQQELTRRGVSRTQESPISAKIVALTDSTCASACLDFMDRLKALPGVLHIGQETSSDTQYLDVRSVALPSKTAVLTFPLKVYRGRLRPANGTYTPDVEIDPATLDLDKVREILAAPTAQ